MDVRAASAAFEACRSNMRTLTRRFERMLYACAWNDERIRAATAVGGRVTQHWVYVSEHQEAVLADRLNAFARAPDIASVRQLMGAGNDVPAWIIESLDDGRLTLELAPLIRAAERILTCRWERVL
jgi:hypothetical protein